MRRKSAPNYDYKKAKCRYEVEFWKERFNDLTEQLYEAIQHIKRIRFCSNCGHETIITTDGHCPLCGGNFSITLFGIPNVSPINSKRRR